MLRSLYSAATGMEAQQTKMDTIAHNLANAGTVGFKRTRAEFEELVSEKLAGAEAPDPTTATSSLPLEVGLGVRTVATSRAMGQGDLLSTQNPLDLAIEGQGFFVVERPDGTEAYTRAGNLRVDAEGRLVTSAGLPLAARIQFPPDAKAITIQPDGVVLAEVPGRVAPMELGRIELARFTNPQGLESLGGTLLAQSAGSGEVKLARPGEDGMGSLAQGFLESANVRAVEEMIDMISTQRAYEMNSKVIQAADQMLQRLTSMR